MITSFIQLLNKLVYTSKPLYINKNKNYLFRPKNTHGYMINKLIKHIQKCLLCPGDCSKAILVAAVIQLPYDNKYIQNKTHIYIQTHFQ